MAARAIGSATVSFGLVSIPVKIYSTGESRSSVRFNMLHAECGTRVKQQYVCPTHDEVVPRNEMARGYEFAKNQYVTLSDEEYKTIQEVATNSIGLVEFVPAAAIDPVYLDKSYYLGPEKGGERAYKLLARAMSESGLVGLANYAARGKQYLVMVRPNAEGGLAMHQLKYADEIKTFDEIPVADAPEASDAELGLARQIIEQIAAQTFDPSKYRDEVKERMLELINQKVEGKEITALPEAAPQAQVIDLMAALKASLGEAAGEPKKTKAAPAKAKAAKAKATKSAPRKKKASS
jgi:DNA end-binding protein Ku